MDLWRALGLGIVQGITEFLPISSSGHLVLGKAILGVHTQGVAYEVAVHLGTFFAILTVFWQDVRAMIAAGLYALKRPSWQGWSEQYRETGAWRLLVLVAVGTLPAVFVGLLFQSSIEAAFSSPLFVCFALLATGTILLGTRWVHGTEVRFGVGRAFFIGLAQALAILPGISRSGSTIAAAMYVKIERSEAARYSFLLALPAILGAGVLEGFELLHRGVGRQESLALAAGFVSAYVSGYIALKWLLSVVRQGRLDRFAYYCYAVALAGLIWLLVSA